jgi:predicted CXXCH cytochrome family protein
VRRSLAAGALLWAVVSAPAAAAPHPRAEGGAACLSGTCHAALGKELAAGASAHDPAASGDCRACHDLALAGAPAFVRGAVAEGAEPPAGGRAWDTALCAGCHAGRLAAEGGAATRFADGARNLHYLHVRASQGRGCLTCHDPHASAQARLLRTEIPARGGVKIPQRFAGTKGGGRCQTGCHAPKEYAR